MSAVEDYIWERPEPQRGLLMRLRQLLFAASPKMQEKIRYNVPFYDCPRWFCYTNPLKAGGVEVCFLRGDELSNEQGLLDARNRRNVCGVTIWDLADLAQKEEALLEIIQEAILLEELNPERPAFSRKK
jgi:hypothetical protein